MQSTKFGDWLTYEFPWWPWTWLPHQPNCSILRQNWLWKGFMLGKENGTIRKSAQEKFKKRERNEKKNLCFWVLQRAVSHSSPQDWRTLNSTLSRFLQLLLTASPFVWEVVRPWSARRNTKAPQHQLFSPSSHSHAALTASVLSY